MRFQSNYRICLMNTKNDMKKLIRRYVLRSLLSSEKGRMKLHQMLQQSVNEEYGEQTIPGNIYNNFIEFVMSNKSLRDAIKRGDLQYIDMVYSGLTSTYYEGITFIKKEKMYEEETL